MYYQMSCGAIGHSKYTYSINKHHKSKEGHENCEIVRRWTYPIQAREALK